MFQFLQTYGPSIGMWDIHSGVDIGLLQNDARQSVSNDLDTCFMLDNTFHWIECKSASNSQSLPDELYKIYAVTQNTGALRVRAHLATLDARIDHWLRNDSHFESLERARLMRINVIPRSTLLEAADAWESDDAERCGALIRTMIAVQQ